MSQLPKEVLDEFIGETREMCERVSLNLGLVEKGEHQDETLNSIYRDIHSIKGASQLFGFQHIGNLAHAMESTLDPIRHHLITVNSDIMDALYAGLDIISKLMTSIVANGIEGTEAVPSIEAVVPKLAALAVRALEGDFKVPKDVLGVTESRSNLQPSEEQKLPVMTRSPLLATVSENSGSGAETKGAKSMHAENSIETAKSTAAHSPVSAAAENQKPTPSRDGASSKDADHGGDASTIRIQVSLLDNLMNLIGELVLIRNQLMQIAGKSENADFLKLGQRLNVVTSELQTDVMKTRMQPVGSIITKFHRVVRDLSRDLDKKIELKIEGAETELDKTLIEAVKDPLTHLVRNCVDHGIEKPEDRKLANKRETGTIVVRSYHEGGQVIIEITDDGRGLHPQKIGIKAVEKGVITQEQFEKLSEQELQALIFAPGFSTAETISNISGRGVGMDVVKTNIEKIGGAIDLTSRPGHGTTVRLKIPLTLAIIPAVVVQCDTARFAVPQVKILELVRIERDTDGARSSKIEFLQGRPVYRLRGKLLPLVDLSVTLKLNMKGTAAPLDQRPVVNIVVLHSDQGAFGLIVDEIVDSADIVVKPLSQALKGLSVYSGATIMGDGSVVLILDVLGLSTISKITSTAKDHNGVGANFGDFVSKSVDATEYLLVDIGVRAKHAIPLCLVNRLEKFTPEQIESSGDQRVVRYREKLLPIVSVSDFLGFKPRRDESGATNEPSEISVIVMSKSNRYFGLEVSDILDVVQIDSQIDMDLKDRAGIHGSVIHGKEVVVVIDALAILDGAMSKLNYGARAQDKILTAARSNSLDGDASSSEDHDVVSKRRKAKILFAEDTPFFRKHIKSTLEGFGFQVVATVNGDEAFKRLEGAVDGEFKLLLTDIEMPIMTGFELAKKVRENKAWSQIPMVALTTRFKDKDIEMGRAVGFAQYLEKFNPEVLLEHLDRILGI